MSWSEDLDRAVARLNPYQRAIHAFVLSEENPRQALRVIACAGAGKSATVVATVADGLRQGAFARKGVIVTTFTRKAGDELVARLTRTTDPAVLDPLVKSRRVGTFHGLALHWLTRHDPAPPEHGWRRSRNISGSTDRARDLPSSLRLWETICESWPIPGTQDPKNPGKPLPGLALPDRYGPDVPNYRKYALQIGILRSKALTPFDDAGIAAATALQGEPGRDGLDRGEYPEILRVWRLYETAKQGLVCYDFDDALYAYWLRGTDRSGTVIVDEAQDNSWIQLDLARKIAERGQGRVVLVGDVRQAIYSFRGADPEIMQHADETLGAATLEIPTNYRSGARIVDVGNLIAENKPWSVGSLAIAARKTPLGETPMGMVRLRGGPSVMAEARDTAREIRKLIDNGAAPSTCAILVRTNAESGPYELAALLEKIPVLVQGATSSFFEKGSIKDVTSLLLLAGKFGPSSRDDRMAAISRWKVLRRKKGPPERFRYMRRDALQDWCYRAVQREDIGQGLSLARQAEVFWKNKNAARWREDLDALREEIEAIAAQPWPECCYAAATVLAPELVEEENAAEDGTSEVAPGESNEDDDGGGEEEDDASVLQAFVEIARQFESPEALRGMAAQMADWIHTLRSPGELSPEAYQQAVANRAVISTIHKAKGLEFKHVWCSSTAGVFPRNPEDPEEQRLFYVAATRAEDTLTLTWTEGTPGGNPLKKAGPSSFITGIVKPYVDRVNRGIPRWADVEPDLVAAASGSWTLDVNRAQAEQHRVGYRWRQPEDVLFLEEIPTTELSRWRLRRADDILGEYDDFADGLAAARTTMAGGVPEIDVAPPDMVQVEHVLGDSTPSASALVTEADVLSIGPAPEETREARFLRWLRARPGEARPGMPWAAFVDWLIGRGPPSWLEDLFHASETPVPAPLSPSTRARAALHRRGAADVPPKVGKPGRMSEGRVSTRTQLTTVVSGPSPGEVQAARGLVAGPPDAVRQALDTLRRAGFSEDDVDIQRLREALGRATRGNYSSVRD